ncbi:MAG: integration host factor subunit alpha [Actinobacteria bacterium]|nr:integration host factor subunit alpha [Actinomycetota bacterium]
MNRDELVARVSRHVDRPKKELKKLVSAVFDEIQKAVVHGEEVSIVGFGKFKPMSRAARTGRDPNTNAVIQIPAGRRPGFLASQQFREKLSGASE